VPRSDRQLGVHLPATPDPVLRDDRAAECGDAFAHALPAVAGGRRIGGEAPPVVEDLDVNRVG